MKKVLSIFLLSILLFPQIVLGQIEIKNPLGADTFEEIIARITNFIFSIALVVAPIMILIAGFLFITAGGSPEQVSRAKRIILWTVVGVVVIALAQGLANVIKSILGA